MEKGRNARIIFTIVNLFRKYMFVTDVTYTVSYTVLKCLQQKRTWRHNIQHRKS